VKIAVVGTGYVGLVAGACFAETGVDVTCVDVDQAKLDRLTQGQVPFFEPGLDQLVKRNWPDRLHFTTNLAEAIQGRQVVFIAVGTPPNEDGSADLSHVLGVAKQVATLAQHELVITLKSTVPVGTNEKVSALVKGLSKHRIEVCSNPEFLKEGEAIGDFQKPDRIVIGTNDDQTFETMSRLYGPFSRQRDRILRMSPKSAEIVKYAANALLATKISFMNEIAGLCEAAGGDVEDVRVALGADPRIGFQFLYPGLGFGGSCFPKDLRALVRTGQDLNVTLSVADAAIAANSRPVEMMLRHLERDLSGVSGKRIAIWGIAFKPKTDDVREAPAIRLMEELVKRGATIQATDPQALETGRVALKAAGIVDKVALFPDAYEACRDADALILCTEWNQYRVPDVERLKRVMRGRHIFDGRNVMSPQDLIAAGFHYQGLGRAS
jgi:UDPglucose 6-dehydrogenase